MNKPLNGMEMLAQPPGWYGLTTFSASKGMRRARMWCRDYNPAKMRAGQCTINDVELRCVERYGKTDSQCNDAMEDFKAQLRERFPGGMAAVEKRSITVSEAIERYLKMQVRGKVAARTQEQYEIQAKAVKALIGNIPLDQLDSLHITDHIEEPGRKRSKERIGLLRRAINTARKCGAWKGTYNVCDAFRQSFSEKSEAARNAPKIDRQPVSDEQIATLLAHVEDDPQWLAFFFVAAFAGPRCSELLNVRIRSYDAANGTLKVNDAKTKAGDRYLVLGHTGRALIERLLKHHAARGYAGEWLFPAQLDGHLTHSNFSKTILKPTLLAAGLAQEIGPGEARNNPDRPRTAKKAIEPEFTMHSFRHTVSTRDRDIVPPFFLDAQLGHSNNLKESDPNAVRMGYAHPQDPSLFPRRREYAELVDARVKALLPKRRHLQAVS